MKHLPAAAFAVAALGALAACSSSDAGDRPAGPVLPSLAASTTAASPAAAAPPTNARGYIPKVLGQEAGLIGSSPAGDSTFSIDKVTRDPKCHQYGSKPESGHTLLLDVRVATGDDSEVARMLAGILNPYSFSEIGNDGITRQSQAGRCTDYRKALPGTFGANQKYAGTIEVVVEEASGSLVLVNPSGGGWEWRY